MSMNDLAEDVWQVRASRSFSLAPEVRSLLPLLAILAAEWALAVAISAATGRPILGASRSVSETALFFMTFLPLIAVFVCIFRMLRDTRPKSPLRTLLAEIKSYAIDARRLRFGLPVIAFAVLFLALFGFIKTSFPLLAPFSWDATLSAWDRALFFGALPHERLQPILSHPLATLLLDLAYRLWFVLLWMSLVACAFMRTTSVLRTRYLCAFFLTWFLQGCVLAIALSSAGPCFYALVEAGPDPYGPLMASLREVGRSLPVSAPEMQAYLWSGYVGEVPPLGISAAPSLHNATSLLMALAAWKVDRRLGLLVSAFAAVIFFGSIGLAWHYAVDGLVAFAATLPIWAASGWIATAWEGPAPRS